MWVLIIVLVAIVLVALYLVALYNGLVQKRNRVDNSWAQIEVQLKRRHDLIPNLVETVKGYAAHERGTFEAVTQARAAAAGAQTPAAIGAAEGLLTQALGRLFAVAEAYPELKANANFLDLQAQLEDPEGKIAVARQVYNDTVLTYNNAIQTFPAVLFAGAFGFKERDFFELEDASDRELPAVDFQADGPARARRRPMRRVTRRARSGAALLATALAALVLAGAAAAKSFRLAAGDRRACRSRGTARFTSTSRSSTRSPARSRAATARSPCARGESIGQVSVLENGRAYRPGGCTELGCADSPGTFGVADLGGRTRIVWHYSAADELRTFELRYTLRGLAVAHDDVVDVNLQVWGDEWKEGLGKLTATLDAPGRIVRVWGHPVYVGGESQLAGKRAVLRALDVPARQFVELRALILRSAFTSSAGMQVVRGNGLAKIVARGERRRGTVRARPRPDRAREAASVAVRCSTCSRSGSCRAASSPAPSSGSTGGSSGPATTGSTSRSRRPTRQPALVPTLLRQGGEAGSFEFTATLFDLIRRGVYRSTPATTERAIWGGLRKETVSDLELSPGEPDGPLTAVGERGHERRRRRPRRRLGASLPLPRAHRGRADGDEPALHHVQGERRRTRSRGAAGSSRRRRAARRRSARVRRRGR